MAGDFEIKVDYGRINSMVRKTGFQVADLLGKAAQSTASRASANTVRVDTGTMKNSWNARQVDRFEWIVGDFGCGYAIYHEYGFHHTSGAYIPASPMIYPALRAEWDIFLKSLQRAGVVL